MAPNVDLLIRGGTVVSVDPAIGTLNDADVLVRDGRIAEVGRGLGGGVRDAEIDRRLADDRDAGPRRDPLAHVELARAQLRDRGLRVLPGQVGDVGPLRARRLLPERGARAGGGAERRDHHGPQLVAQHAHARARRRGAGGPSRHPGPRPLRVRPHRLPRRQHAARLHRHRPRSARVVRGRRRRSAGASISGSTCADRTSAAWPCSTPRWPRSRPASLPVAIHTVQGASTAVDATELERKGYLGPDFLIAHFLAATADGPRGAGSDGHPAELRRPFGAAPWRCRRSRALRCCRSSLPAWTCRSRSTPPRSPRSTCSRR